MSVNSASGSDCYEQLLQALRAEDEKRNSPSFLHPQSSKNVYDMFVKADQAPHSIRDTELERVAFVAMSENSKAYARFVANKISNENTRNRTLQTLNNIDKPIPPIQNIRPTFLEDFPW